MLICPMEMAISEKTMEVFTFSGIFPTFTTIWRMILSDDDMLEKDRLIFSTNMSLLETNNIWKRTYIW